MNDFPLIETEQSITLILSLQVTPAVLTFILLGAVNWTVPPFGIPI
jgi:hypothetical protein